MSPHSHTYIHHFTLSKEHEYVLLIAAIRTFLYTGKNMLTAVNRNVLIAAIKSTYSCSLDSVK